jgi:hypothetical protein
MHLLQIQAGGPPALLLQAPRAGSTTSGTSEIRRAAELKVQSAEEIRSEAVSLVQGLMVIHFKKYEEYM